MRMRKYVKSALQSLAFIWICSAHAGSYEDFFIAVRNDNASVVSNLLTRGFEPNARDPKGQTGLMIAMQEGALKAARALLAQPGIDVDALNAAGESALMLAALKGDLPGARALLDRGARINQPGWSAIHYAATGPEPQAVQLLLDRGADIDAASPNQTTPLMMAAQYGSEDSVTVLLKRGADAKRRNQRALGAADFARLAGRDALAKRLEQAAQ
jgi:uncharacterized protein